MSERAKCERGRVRLGASACACTERYGPALTLGTREGGGGAGAASVPMSGSSDVALSPVFVVGGELDGKEHGVVACLAGDQGRLRLSSNAGLSFFAYVSVGREKVGGVTIFGRDGSLMIVGETF